jgi:hypothetical protein
MPKLIVRKLNAVVGDLGEGFDHILERRGLRGLGNVVEEFHGVVHV